MSEKAEITKEAQKRTPPKTKGLTPAQTLRKFVKHTPRMNKALR